LGLGCGFAFRFPTQKPHGNRSYGRNREKEPPSFADRHHRIFLTHNKAEGTRSFGSVKRRIASSKKKASSREVAYGSRYMQRISWLDVTGHVAIARR
jgi:hypothetical protein